jgi:hypothetical protein
MRLMGARAAEKPEMRCDDPDGAAGFQFDFCDNRAARLQPRKGYLMHVADNAPPEKQDVSVPAMRSHVSRYRHKRQARLALETREVEQALAIAETLISFLQSYDVRIYFMNDPESSFGIKPSVGADAFVDVVGSHQHARLFHAFRRRRLSGALPTHSKLFEDLCGETRAEPVHDHSRLSVDFARKSQAASVIWVPVNSTAIDR